MAGHTRFGTLECWQEQRRDEGVKSDGAGRAEKPAKGKCRKTEVTGGGLPTAPWQEQLLSLPR